jgi:hypothetical protein
MLANRQELQSTLAGGDLLGAVFARHAYGMRRWVDLFAARIPLIDDPAAKELLASLVADNARHMNLFRERAIARGVDPDGYVAPLEGEAIYERLHELTDQRHVEAFALGSLDHFAELLAVYAGAARDGDATAIESVRSDVERARAELRGRVDDLGERVAVHAREAHELYRRREIVETPRYAGVG